MSATINHKRKEIQLTFQDGKYNVCFLDYSGSMVDLKHFLNVSKSSLKRIEEFAYKSDNYRTFILLREKYVVVAFEKDFDARKAAEKIWNEKQTSELVSSIIASWN